MLIFRRDSVIDKKIKRSSLFRVIEESKAEDGAIVQVAAANAITVLNMLETSFSAMDFSNIKVPGADLSFAILHHTNLQGADLSRVNLKKAFLCFANFTKANLSEVFFG